MRAELLPCAVRLPSFVLIARVVFLEHGHTHTHKLYTADYCTYALDAAGRVMGVSN